MFIKVIEIEKQDEINEFLKENSNRVDGKNIYFFDKKAVFMGISDFEPEKDEKLTKRLIWNQDFMKNCQTIANLEKRLGVFKKMSPDEKVEERPVSQPVNGLQGAQIITAGMACKEIEEGIAELHSENEVLSQLIKENEN